MWHNVNHVDFVEVWLLIVDDVSEVISVFKNVLTGVHEHFKLIGYEHF
jgi:hypothetical protein